MLADMGKRGYTQGHDKSRRTRDLQTAWSRYPHARHRLEAVRLVRSLVREVHTIEEREDDPPEDEQDGFDKLRRETLDRMKERPKESH